MKILGRFLTRPAKGKIMCYIHFFNLFLIVLSIISFQNNSLSELFLYIIVAWWSVFTGFIAKSKIPNGKNIIGVFLLISISISVNSWFVYYIVPCFLYNSIISTAISFFTLILYVISEKDILVLNKPYYEYTEYRYIYSTDMREYKMNVEKSPENIYHYLENINNAENSELKGKYIEDLRDNLRKTQYIMTEKEHNNIINLINSLIDNYKNNSLINAYEIKSLIENGSLIEKQK